MEMIFLLEVEVQPTVNPSAAAADVYAAIEKSVEEVQAQRLQLFQVTGENKIIAVIGGAVHHVTQAINMAAGDCARIKCTPLRTYENFARNICAVDNEKILTPYRHIDKDGVVFWVHGKVEYNGVGTMADFWKLWKEEVEGALAARAEGHVQMDVYKVAAQREVHVFLKLFSVDDLDDLAFELPVMQEMGHNVHLTCKVLHFLD